VFDPVTAKRASRSAIVSQFRGAVTGGVHLARLVSVITGAVSAAFYLTHYEGKVFNVIRKREPTSEKAVRRYEPVLHNTSRE
jgi:hypothetical protein